MPSQKDVHKFFVDEDYVDEAPPEKLPGRIHLVLHSYFRFRGDAPILSDYIFFLERYSHKVWLYVDEVHFFLERSSRTFPWKRIHLTTNNYRRIVGSNSKLLSSDYGSSSKLELVENEVSLTETKMFIFTCTDALMYQRYSYQLPDTTDDSLEISPTFALATFCILRRPIY